MDDNSGDYKLEIIKTASLRKLPINTTQTANAINTTLWQFSAWRGQFITIEATALSEAFVPQLVLHDSNGNYFAEGQETADGRSTVIANIFIPTDGDYLIQILNYGDQPNGIYTLSVSLQDPQSIPSIALGDSHFGDISRDQLWLLETMSESVSASLISITMSAINDTVYFTPSFKLLDENGIEVTAFTPEGSSEEIAAVYIVSPNMTYYLHTTSAYGETEGQYLIRAEAEATTFQQIAIDGASERGNTQSEPFWVFTGSAGERVIITMSETDGVLDTVLSLRDPAGQEIAYNDDDNSSGTYNSRIEIDLPVSGVYFIHAQGYAGAIGDYELTVQRSQP